MIASELTKVFERDLHKLKDELLLFKNEENLWIVKGDVKNSAGNLFLHLTGNMNHFIGAILGSSGYVRDRDSEFSSRNIPKEKILSGIESTIPVIVSTLQKLTDYSLNEIFPVKKHDETVTTGFMLLHLLTHFNYHLGQINYLRRILEG